MVPITGSSTITTSQIALPTPGMSRRRNMSNIAKTQIETRPNQANTATR